MEYPKTICKLGLCSEMEYEHTENMARTGINSNSQQVQEDCLML